MSRPIYTRIYVVRFHTGKHVAYVRAIDLLCEDKFTHFLDVKGRTIHSLATDNILDISTREFTVHEINDTFPKRINYVELLTVKKSSAAPAALATVHKLHR